MDPVVFALVIVLLLVAVAGGHRRRCNRQSCCGFVDKATEKRPCGRICPNGFECSLEDHKEWCRKKALAEVKDPWEPLAKAI
jgi:hypothetical protein